MSLKKQRLSSRISNECRVGQYLFSEVSLSKSSNQTYLSNMAVLVATLLLICLFVLCGLLILKSVHRKCTLPGPTWLPVIGTVPKLGKKPYEDFATLSRKYGNIFKYRLGIFDIVILNSYNVIDDVFRKHKESFSDRLLTLPEDVHLPLGFAEMQFCERYQELKFAAMSILNSPDMGDQSFADIVNKEMSSTFDFIIKEHGLRAFSPTIPFGRCIANIMFTVLFGHRPAFDQQKLDWYIDAMREVQEFGNMPNSYTFQTTVKKLIRDIAPITGPAVSTERAMEILRELSHGEIAGYKALDEKMGSVNFMEKFILLAGEKTTKMEKTYVSEVALPGVIVNLILGSLESTSMVMCWISLLLAMRQDVQMKLRKEVDAIIGSERRPTLRDRDSMPYSLAVLQETFRFVSPVPLGTPHRAGKDGTYKGCFIPKGTRLVSNIWAVHNNKEVFPEPQKFKPERFINEKGDFVKSKHVVPFSIGARSCPGEVIAQRELFLFLVCLVQTFDIRPPEGGDLPNVPEEDIFNGIGTHPPPFQICCAPVEIRGTK